MITQDFECGFCVSEDDINLLREASVDCHPSIRSTLLSTLEGKKVSSVDGLLDLELSCIVWMRLSEIMAKNAMKHDHAEEATARFELARFIYQRAHGRLLHGYGV